MYNHAIERDCILCPFHHHPICSLQFIQPPSPFLSHNLPFLNVSRSLILPENATTKYIYIYIYIYMYIYRSFPRTAIRGLWWRPWDISEHDQEVCVYGFTRRWQSGTMQPYTQRHTETSLGEPNHSFCSMLCIILWVKLWMPTYRFYPLVTLSFIATGRKWKNWHKIFNSGAGFYTSK
jgi:hypothetical protein